MKVNKIAAKLTAAALAFSALSLVPGPTISAEELPEESKNLHLNKKAEINEDGTYKITLESYTTGLVTPAQAIPTDVVLVLDTSGSMKDNVSTSGTYSEYKNEKFGDIYSNQNNLYYKLADGTYKHVTVTRTSWYGTYTLKLGSEFTTTGSKDDRYNPSEDAHKIYYYTSTSSASKMSLLKKAVTDFIDRTNEINSGISNDSKKNRIGIVTYASNSYYVTNTDSNADSGELMIISDDNASDIKRRINGLSANGATRADYGLENAKNLLVPHITPERNQVVIFFTDGVPTTSDTFANTVAKNAVGYSGEMKSDGVTVYSIGIQAGADPETDPAEYQRSTAESDKANLFMHAVSSNYVNATDYKYDYLGNRNDKGNYYLATSDSMNLSDIFQTIQEIVNPDTPLDNQSMMKDIMGDNFELTSASTVTAKTYNYTGYDVNNPTFSEAASANVMGTKLSDGATPDTSKLSAYIDPATNSAWVTGFNYKEQSIMNPSSGPVGQKLVMEIDKVQLKSDTSDFSKVTVGENNELSVSNKSFPTNAKGSAIYDKNGKLVKEFVSPDTLILSQQIVIDYGSTAVISNSLLNYTSDWKGNLYTNTLAPTADATKSVSQTGVYGTVGNGNEYTVKTTKWNGYDQYLALGNSTAAIDATVTASHPNNRVWTKVSLLPASNVYYDDTFVTTGGENGTVGIEYGYAHKDENNKFQFEYDADAVKASGVWSTDGTHLASNWTENQDQNFGYEQNLGSQAGDSFGSSHVANSDFSKSKIATARFTFTGTAFDLYSRTNLGTGVVNVKVYKGEGVDPKALVYNMNVDTYGAHNGVDYYQIPALFYKADEYGTYHVVLTAVNRTNRTSTFYIDGIRIYNPMNKKDAITEDAYGNQSNAKFVNLRDILIDANTVEQFDPQTQDSMLFIDNVPTTETTGDQSSELAEYIEYGPKNEVYLAKGNSVVLKPSSNRNAKYRISMKVINNKTSDDEKTNASVSVTHPTDTNSAAGLTINGNHEMYYDVNPSDGYIIIRNTSKNENIVAISKIMVYGEEAAVEANNFRNNDVQEALSYSAAFNSLPVEDMSETGGDDGSDVDPGDVDIDNPDNGDNGDEDNNPYNPLKWLEDLFKGFRDIFH